MSNEFSKVKTCLVQQKQIAYRECGPNDKPSLLLLHGMAETSDFFWDPLVEALKDQYHIVALDLLGHGDSSRPFMGYAPKTQVALYQAVIQQLNLKDVIVVGHSLGGIIGSSMAVLHPNLIKGLILYDTPIPKGILGNVSLLLDIKPLVTLGIAPLVILPGIGLLLDLITPKPLRKIIINNILWTWKVPYDRKMMTDAFKTQAIRNSYFSLEQSLRFLFLFFNLEAHISHIHCPTLILMGDDDTLFSVKRAKSIVRKIPNGQMQVIPNAGHLSLVDQPSIFLQHLQTWSWSLPDKME